MKAPAAPSPETTLKVVLSVSENKGTIQTLSERTPSPETFFKVKRMVTKIKWLI